MNNPVPGDDDIPDEILDYAVYGREIAPETGTLHCQGFCIFKKDQRLSALKKILPRAHWEKCNGTVEQNIAYCKKDGDFMEVGTPPKTSQGTKRARDEHQNAVATKALNADTVAQGMQIIREELPFDFLRFGETMERNLKRSKIEATVPPFKPEAFNHAPLTLTGKSTLIWGPSNTGKTSFALSHFERPLLVSHIDTLKQLNPDHDGVVFDDMSFRHWPVESVIHLLDYEFTRDINVRYGTVNIPAKLIKVFTHNTENPFYKEEDIQQAQQEAIARRLTRVHVVGNLYN